MNKFLIIAIIIIIVGAGAYFVFRDSGKKEIPQPSPENITASPNQTINNITMKISSSAFQAQQNIPVKYTCDGQNINPPLSFANVPNGTQSLVLIVDDPDAPSGTWTHWTLWNINPQIAGIDENSVSPGAVQGKTSFGKPGWGGPCPPSGTHRYFFKLYALDANLNLSDSADAQGLQDTMRDHIIESAELIGLYSRQAK